MEQLNTISRDELKAKLDRNDDFLLYEVSEKPSFDEAHLPGATHFEGIEKIEEAIPGADHEIVLYSENLRDRASLRVVRELTGMGYRHVYEYEDGKADWLSEDLPTEAS